MIPNKWKAATEVKVVCALLLGLGLAYVAMAGILMLAPYSSARTFLLPGTSLLLGGLVVAGLVLRMSSARFAGFGVSFLFALLHALSMLAAELFWVKIVSGILFAGYIYAAVLLNSMPVKRYLLGATNDA
ncbi:hypothetical protein [Amycolatopsis regifaucium]|uniref:Uncharacterized protein n=1 Tax=Amycolatopsis regifaucium TaxID=546365 RepID=A0A154MMX5_9PSEU|nr:hypothetical protein [Amycolatopsis regifaucium]KZB85704.1 hypothetical protein AVL48_30075 [Amycolatopsis regifaucium]OKA10541.1 hypothetical protein ATP06_0203830 [Amycolatopsis regifaucium]SFI81400.1 hypothetical protein SAMN04489731_113137 [Amycolatopsis regifaucium]